MIEIVPSDSYEFQGNDSEDLEVAYNNGAAACAATPWNYDMDATPKGNIRMIIPFKFPHTGQLSWAEGWHDSYHKRFRTHDGMIQEPIAWAEVNMSKEEEDE